MESHLTTDAGKKNLEDLSKDELIKRCERLLAIAQKAKQAKDIAQEENSELKERLKSEDENATKEVVEKLTQQKLVHVNKIEDLKSQIIVLTNQLQKCTESLHLGEEKNSTLHNENVDFKKQIKCLSDENKRLIIHLESLEKQIEECQRLGLQQQNQLLALEKSKQLLEDHNSQLTDEATHSQAAELQKMLSISLDEVKKLQSDNGSIKEKMENMKLNLSEKDKIIVMLNSELESQTSICRDLQIQLEGSTTNLEIWKNDNERLKGEVENLETSNSGLFKETEVLKDVQQTFQRDTETSIGQLNETIEKSKQKLKSYHTKLVKLVSNIKHIKEDRNEVFTLFKSYTNQVNEWRDQLNAASDQLCQYVTQIHAKNMEYLTEINVLKESNAKFLEQLEAHKTDDEKSKELNEIEYIKSENSRLLAEISRLLELESEHKLQLDTMSTDRNNATEELTLMIQNHETQLKAFNDQNKKDMLEIQNRKEENEKICIEYRKIISKLEEDVNIYLQEGDEWKLKYKNLEESVSCAKEVEREIVEKTSQEILKLVQENAQLLEENCGLKELKTAKEGSCQNEQPKPNDLEEAVASLKRENSELLSEMNEMNQALKQRGETISKFQSHCEEVMKKLQVYETQANLTVDSISQKDEVIYKLKEEIEKLKKQNKIVAKEGDNEDNKELADLRIEVSNLRDKLNANLDSSYAESETMSTSTISRTEEGNRLKELEGSWEERYGKLRTLALKLKGKVRDLSNELSKEQNEKAEVQQKCAINLKTISTMQTQCDNLQDELDANKILLKEYSTNADAAALEISKAKQKLEANDKIIDELKGKVDELTQEKTNTETWKKQIGAKVQAFRKELEANKVLKKEFEAKIAQLTAEVEAKEEALRAESVGHQQTKTSLEHSNNERIKNSVLNLEMQDYERSVKELSQKLAKKQDEIGLLKSQLESQKSTASAIREQNNVLEECTEQMKNNVNAVQAEVAASRKQISELEEAVAQKESKIQDLTKLIETTRSANEELSTELSKVIAEHQKLNGSLKNEKEHLQGQILGLQQSLRDIQDTLKLKEDELTIVQNDYGSYKVRAQSVLRQSQNRDVGLEEKLSDELSAVKEKYIGFGAELKDCKIIIDQLRKDNEMLTQEKNVMSGKCEELTSETEDIKLLYEQLSNKHQQTIIDNAETVRSLKVHAETLAQCYRQQISEQEVRHNREIIELQSKIEMAPSPSAELPFLQLAPMHREEGEGSESTETTNKNNSLHPLPLERLLEADLDQEVTLVKKLLGEEETKVTHLTDLLADAEQDLAKHVQMNQLLKEEIRRQQRSVEREKHAENLEYLKNVVLKFLTLQSGDERSRLIPVLNTILKLSPEETQQLNMVVKGEPGVKGWTNYLWSPKPS